MTKEKKKMRKKMRKRKEERNQERGKKWRKRKRGKRTIRKIEKNEASCFSRRNGHSTSAWKYKIDRAEVRRKKERKK